MLLDCVPGTVSSGPWPELLPTMHHSSVTEVMASEEFVRKAPCQCAYRPSTALEYLWRVARRACFEL